MMGRAVSREIVRPGKNTAPERDTGLNHTIYRYSIKKAIQPVYTSKQHIGLLKVAIKCKLGWCPLCIHRLSFHQVFYKNKRPFCNVNTEQ